MSHIGAYVDATRTMANLQIRVDRLEAALRAIIKHQETISGSMSQYSKTIYIAEKALADE
tara:strand:- start:10663 stop:10842 length:180 start_codon:yes stop_codon:yes gene_type:complete